MYAPSLSGWYTPGAVERSFQLAASGNYRSIAAIQRQLYREHYDDVVDHLAGQLIRQQLNRVIVEARRSRSRRSAEGTPRQVPSAAVGPGAAMPAHLLSLTDCQSAAVTPSNTVASALREGAFALDWPVGVPPNERNRGMTKQKNPAGQMQKQRGHPGQQPQPTMEQGQQPIIGQQPKRRQQAEQPEGQLQQERESGEQRAFVRGEER